MITKIKSNLQIYNFLLQKKKDLERRVRELTREDPFNNKDRLLDNAASDTEAREEVGHEQVTTLKDEITKEVSLVKKALSRIGIGKYGICESCNKKIDTARLKVFPQATYCIECEHTKEKA